MSGIISRARALVCTRCGGIMGTHLPWCRGQRIMSAIYRLTAIMALAITAAAGLAVPASACTTPPAHHRHHARLDRCAYSEWGAIWQPGTRSFICEPAGDAAYPVAGTPFWWYPLAGRVLG